MKEDLASEIQLSNPPLSTELERERAPALLWTWSIICLTLCLLCRASISLGRVTSSCGSVSSEEGKGSRLCTQWSMLKGWSKGIKRITLFMCRKYPPPLNMHNSNIFGQHASLWFGSFMYFNNKHKFLNCSLCSAWFSCWEKDRERVRWHIYCGTKCIAVYNTSSWTHTLSLSSLAADILLCTAGIALTFAPMPV